MFVNYVHQAGKRLLLITNSDYHYTDKMMKHSFNRFLPNDMGWRDLFDMVSIVLLYISTIKHCKPSPPLPRISKVSYESDASDVSPIGEE